MKKLKPCNYAGEAKNAIISAIIAQKEESDYADACDAEHRFSTFVIRKRNNFYFSSLIGSLMCLLALGLVTNVLSTIFQLGSFRHKKI